MKGLKYQLKIRAGKSLCGEEELFPPGQPSSSPTFPAPEGDREHGFCHRGWQFLLKVLRLQGAVSLCSGLLEPRRETGRAAAPVLLSLADLRVKQGASLVVQWLGIRLPTPGAQVQSSCSPQLEKACMQQQRPSVTKHK